MGRGDPGPNAEAVDEFLRGLDHLSDFELRQLAAFGGGRSPERDVARREAERLARESGREEELRSVREHLIRWATALPSGEAGVFGGTGNPDHLDARRSAFGVINDAVTALLLRDLLSADDFRALYEPWEEGAPR